MKEDIHGIQKVIWLHPAWVHGLKGKPIAIIKIHSTLHPAWGAWIEGLKYMKMNCFTVRLHPAWVHGLKEILL